MNLCCLQIISVWLILGFIEVLSLRRSIFLFWRVWVWGVFCESKGELKKERRFGSCSVLGKEGVKICFTSSPSLLCGIRQLVYALARTLSWTLFFTLFFIYHVPRKNSDLRRVSRTEHQILRWAGNQVLSIWYPWKQGECAWHCKGLNQNFFPWFLWRQSRSWSENWPFAYLRLRSSFRSFPLL